jgi:ribosomal protein S18 acetylase RimI-like enzyme
MSEITMRAATPSDIPTLLPMMNEFNRLEDIDVDPALHREALGTLLDQPDLGRVFLFESRGSAAGYAVLTFNYDLEFAGRDAFLTEVFVVGPLRGMGHGKHMLREIERAAVADDVKAIHLMVRPENTIAQRLYSASGYSPPTRLTLGKVLSPGPAR